MPAVGRASPEPAEGPSWPRTRGRDSPATPAETSALHCFAACRRPQSRRPEAAKRRKSAAHGEAVGRRRRNQQAPEGAKDTRSDFTIPPRYYRSRIGSAAQNIPAQYTPRRHYDPILTVKRTGNSKRLKILPLNCCSPEIFPAFPPNPMIPIDRGGRGIPKITKK